MRFTRTAEDGTVTTVTGDYDYMGRRIFKKVETTVADPETGESTTSVILNHRYLYRGYLQIAALDLTRTTLNALWYILWDPTEPVATRPLAIQTAGSWFAYGWDLTKNVMELYKSNGTIANSYSYAPFGEVTQRGNITNPLQWSSEMFDGELGLVYYNYRHYNPHDGKWTTRDPIGIEGGWNLYRFALNTPVRKSDYLGNNPIESALPAAAALAACDGPLPVGDIAATAVMAGACAYAATQPAPWSGDCSVAMHAALQANVELAKSNVGMLGKCKTKNCCWMLRIKKKAWLALATARSIINNTCFRGGDATHQDEEAKAWAKVSECEQIIAMECND